MVSAAVIVYLGVTVLAALGIFRIEFDYSLNRSFKSDGSRFTDYSQFIGEFGNHSDLYILVEGIDYSRPGHVQALLDFTLELLLTDSIDTVLSPFSVPVPDGRGGVASLDGLADPTEQVFARALNRQPALARVMSAVHSAALVTVLSETSSSEVRESIPRAGARLAAVGLSYRLAGLPAIDHRAQTVLVHDFIVLNGIGMVLGTLVTLIALRGIWLTGLTVFTAGSALVWGMGAFGWLGFGINAVSIALPVLLLALAFSDAIHLGMEQRLCVQYGRANPVRQAIDRVGPAAVLTSLTTAGAFATLCLSEAEVIRELGFGGALAVLSACAGGLLANALGGAGLLAVLARRKVHPPGGAALNRLLFWHWLPRAGIAAPTLFSGIAVAASLLATALYFTASPRFSLEENLNAGDTVLGAQQRIKEVFGPTASLQIPVRIVNGDSLKTARAVEAVLTSGPLPYAPVSTVALADTADRANMSLEELASGLPRSMQGPFVGSPADRIVVALPFEYRGAAATRSLTEMIEARLQTAPSELKAGIGRPTGLYVMSSYIADEMIRSLIIGLIVAVALSALVIGLWMRSARIAVLSLFPNVLPVATIGATFAASGYGITFSGGIALTLAFGIAIDDTIHVLNRYRLQMREGVLGLAAIEAAALQATPAIVLTSGVLITGLAGTLAAEMPTIVLFGVLSMLVFLLAMIADLLLLPALLARFAA